MSKRSFHTELRQYLCLLTGNNALAHDDAWDNLMEEVDNAYAAFLRDKDSNGIHFSNVISEVEALDLDVEIAGIPDHIEKSDDLKCMATEVEDKIRQLVMGGYPIDTIESWLQKAVKLSRVKVTADYRIFLTDYDKEITMRQLPKTLFIFFLKHPEGCRLKDLCDHRDELLSIYQKLSITDDQNQIESSIDVLVNPISNSFSEKCVAIKYAFLKELPMHFAKHYFIKGHQGGIKGINLDRALVSWEI